MKKLLVMLMLVVGSISSMAYTQEALDTIRVTQKIIVRQTGYDINDFNYSPIYELNTGEYMLVSTSAYDESLGSFVVIFNSKGTISTSEFLNKVTKEELLILMKAQGLTVKNTFKNKLK